MSLARNIILILYGSRDTNEIEKTIRSDKRFKLRNLRILNLKEFSSPSLHDSDLLILDERIAQDSEFQSQFVSKNKNPYLILLFDPDSFLSIEDENHFGYLNVLSKSNYTLQILNHVFTQIKFISDLKNQESPLPDSIEELLLKSENQDQLEHLSFGLAKKTHELLQMGYWIYEESGRVYWSDEILKVFDHKDKHRKFTFDLFLEKIPLGLRSKLVDWLKSYFQGQRPASFEFHILDTDGNSIYFECHGELIKGLHGKRPYLLVGMINLTDRKLFELMLSKSQRFAQATIDSLHGQIAVINRESTIVAINHSWKEHYNECGSEDNNSGLEENYFNFFDHADLTIKVGDKKIKLSEAIELLHKNQITAIDFEFPLHLPLQERWFNVRISKFPDNSGYLLVEHEPINRQKVIESRLRLMANIFKNAKEGIFITDTNGIILEVNETFTEITGYSREEVLGQNPRILKSGRQSDEFYASLWHDISVKGHWYGEVWNRRKNGEVYAEMASINAVTNEAGENQNYVAIFSDITWIKEHERQLKHIAHYDALTGLPNRVLLADRLSQAMDEALRRGKILTIAYLDLDGFKQINDDHGHGIGDDILIILTKRFINALRDGDTLARIGGDEFIAVISDLDKPHDCEPILNDLLLAAREPIEINDEWIVLSASIGATIYPQDTAEGEQLLRHADQAMYMAKLSGKNCYHLFDISLDLAIKTRRESLEQIRHALQEKQFVLYYQPKVNMKTGVVIGVEALIRWRHPNRGLIAPVHFLPIIEEHSEAVVLGEWVIQEALKQMHEWNLVGIRLKISVNIGARQIQQSDFVSRLSEILKENPLISATDLELEILETSALEDLAKVSSVMQACKKIGVQFAIDDFGTGYSSLTYLKHLPADILKIDQSFVKDMLLYPDDMAIVKGVIGLVAAFQRDVIAEGVESIEHGASLIKLGCFMGQGYGIAKPMPPEDLPMWLTNWKPDSTWIN